jgi:hypothetical protein
MAHWEPWHYTEVFSAEEIAEMEALGIPKDDLHEILVMTKRHNIALEDAKKALIEKKAAEYCPYCDEFLGGRLKKRYKNKHINEHKKKNHSVKFGPNAQPTEQTQVESPPDSSASTPAPATPTPAVEQTQVESPAESPASSTTPTTPTSSASSASSFSSPSSTPKRRFDDENELLSTDDQPGETTQDNDAPEQSDAAPIAKRPKLQKDIIEDPIICSATFQKLPGEFSIDGAREYITWYPEDRTAAQPVVIRMADVANYQRNTGPRIPEAKRGLVHKTLSKETDEEEPTSRFFHFTPTDDGRRASEAVQEVMKSTTAAKEKEAAREAEAARLIEGEDEGGEEIEWETVMPKL